MTGLVEVVLAERYGAPTIVPGTEFLEYRWNEKSEPFHCVLYKTIADIRSWDAEPRVLEKIYGDALGGFLLLDSLKLAMLAGPPVYGLYGIDELRGQPEVLAAKRLDPDIEFFMDAANVWFYGIRDKGQLYVYDSETAELTELGPLGQAFRQLLQQWHEATST